MTFSRRQALLAAAAAMAPAGTVRADSGQADAERPNIVLIFTDDQGYADVGAFGAKPDSTPNLDAMAREGRRYTNFHVAQAVCSASRAALLTGCYPNRIGIHGALGPKATHGLADSETTLAEMLRACGYATGMAGKWHLGHHRPFLPTHHGFDEYIGLPYSNDMWPHHPEVRPGTFPPLPLIEGDRVKQDGLGHEDQARLTGLLTERAVRFIERNRNRPFFFYLAHSMPHVPLYAGEKFRGKSGRGLYADVMREIDGSVGEVLKALQRCGVEKNTLVIFTSDNGPWLSYGNHAGSAGPLREGKGTAWEGGTRVPCILRWPGRIPAGTVSDDMLMTIDLLPTIAGRVKGAKLPAHRIDGRDVWPLLSGRPGAARNPHESYWWYYATNELQGVSSGDGRWKLMLPHSYRTLRGRPGGTDGIPAKYEMRAVEKPELYDLRTDIGETADVSARHPDIARSLLAQAEKAREELGDSLTKRVGKGSREPGRLPAAS